MVMTGTENTYFQLYAIIPNDSVTLNHNKYPKTWRDMSHMEKRRSPRLDTNNFISYYLLDENDKIYSEGFGKTKNISDVGLLMATGKEIESA